VALSAREEALVAALEGGLALVPHPYRALGAGIGLSEEEVIAGIGALLADGAIARLGVVVNHRALGWRDNAMVVFDVPDGEVDETGEWLGRQDGITLCYRRPRRPPGWPYNLFCMMHGRARAEVRARLQRLREQPRLSRVPYAVLFSTRCFKQRGARYRGEAGNGGVGNGCAGNGGGGGACDEPR